MSNKQFKHLDENGLLFLWQQILGRFVKQEEGKGLSTNDLTDELLHKIQNAGDSSFDGNYNSLTNIPQINGIALIGNKTLDDLGITNAIHDAIGEVNQISYEIVENFDSLPVIGSAGVFYLVPNNNIDMNQYDEYVWINSSNRYELLGSVQTSIDMNDYIKKEDFTALSNQEILDAINGVTI